MSHFSSIKTKIVEKEYLLQALDDLGYVYQDSPGKIKGWGRESRKVDIRVKSGLRYRIGFQSTADGYTITADWMTIKEKKQAFADKVMQRYAYHATKATLAKQGFDLVSESVNEEGKIHLVLRRTA